MTKELIEYVYSEDQCQCGGVSSIKARVENGVFHLYDEQICEHGRRNDDD